MLVVQEHLSVARVPVLRHYDLLPKDGAREKAVIT